jgi:DUF971 family protein
MKYLLIDRFLFFLILVSVGCSNPVEDNGNQQQINEKPKYAIIISPVPNNGLIEPSITKAEAGTLINLEITPSNGCILVDGSLVYNDGTDHMIDGNSFTMPAHNVTVTGVFRNPGLEELKAILIFLQSPENSLKGFSKNDPILVSITSQVSLEHLYDTLESAKKYVTLDFSNSGITTWNYVREHKLGKEKIVSLILPDTLTDLPDNIYVNYGEGFASFDNLTSITGINVQTIGNAFENCQSLTSVNLPAVTTLGNSTFFGCYKLTEITLLSALSIGNSAFGYCSRLERINLPIATTIAYSAFFGCYNLAEINIPAVTFIDKFAFYGCDILENIAISANAIIGDGAFRGCSSLVFSVTGAGSLSTTENGKALLKDNATLVAYPSATGAINIPSDITNIGNYAFASTDIISIAASGVIAVGDSSFLSCNKLKTIYFENVNRIGVQAFSACNQLSEVNFPYAQIIDTNAFGSCVNLVTVNLPVITIIENAVFSQCGRLTTVNIPNVTTINFRAFFGCIGIVSLYLQNLTSIGDNAFESCYGLRTLRMGTIPPETVGENIFQSIQGTITLQVPIGTLSAYQTWERANRQAMWWSVNIVETSI